MKHLLTVLFILFSFGAFAQATDTATLKSTATDPNNFPISYQWTQISGTTVTIVSPSSQNTVIRNIKEGVSVFQIKATNSYGAFATSTVKVTATKNQPPVIIANPDIYIILPTN